MKKLILLAVAALTLSGCFLDDLCGTGGDDDDDDPRGLKTKRTIIQPVEGPWLNR